LKSKGFARLLVLAGIRSHPIFHDGYKHIPPNPAFHREDLGSGIQPLNAAAFSQALHQIKYPLLEFENTTAPKSATEKNRAITNTNKISLLTEWVALFFLITPPPSILAVI
jgi:hypothetical protein